MDMTRHIFSAICAGKQETKSGFLGLHEFKSIKSRADILDLLRFIDASQYCS
jgi:hypothetical protein